MRLHWTWGGGVCNLGTLGHDSGFTAKGSCWLFLERFGFGAQDAIIAGTLFWLSVFVILWLGLYNMNLATPTILATTALPLALVEMLVAAVIVDRVMGQTNRDNE